MLDKLIDQYKEIMGISNLSINDIKKDSFRKDFTSWLAERQQYGNRYFDFLYEMKQAILERTTAEVGKCEFDSLVIPFDTTIISPNSFESVEDKGRIIGSKFIVYDGQPVLYFEITEQPKLVLLPEKRIDTFMTQNPYSPYSVKNWSDLHNGGYFDIAVGVYGSIYDKNIKSNLELLKYIKDRIVLTDYKYDLNHDGDIYYGAIVSDRKDKEYKKLR